MNATEERNSSAKGEGSRHESRSSEDNGGCKRKSRRHG